MLSSKANSVIQSGEHAPLVRQMRLTRTVVCATLTACLGAISFGFVLGYTSPVENDLQSKMKWSDEEFSWFSVSVIINGGSNFIFNWLCLVKLRRLVINVTV